MRQTSLWCVVLFGVRCARSQATGGDAVEGMRMFVGLFGDGGGALAVEDVCKWTGLFGGGGGGGGWGKLGDW
jgi:hypothetical protein